MKHTPGPYVIRETGSIHGGYTIEKMDAGLRSVIAQTDEAWLCAEHGGCGVECNTRLIAAAPELLDALTDLVGGCGKEGDLFSSEAMQKAKAAIAKAEGA